MNIKTVLVIFGGKSVEHEVSVSTAYQVFKNINVKKYRIIPVYIDTMGIWWTGKPLENIKYFKKVIVAMNGMRKCRLFQAKIEGNFLEIDYMLIKRKVKFDIALPIIHGTNGEDGTIQGMLEILNIPYVGCDVFSSAVGMDKVAQKIIFSAEKIETIPFKYFWNYEWVKNKNEVVKKIETIKYPLCIKPCNLGSSIGISIANNRKELIKSIEVAIHFDKRIIVEKAITDMKELNCSVAGYGEETLVSVCEQPIKTGKILSYDDKYKKGSKNKGLMSLSRLIPAPISRKLQNQIEEWSIRAFRAIGASGVSRIDYIYDNTSNKIYLNEINTIPGSLSFYLWKKSGLTYSDLLDKLIDWGFKKYEVKNSQLTVYKNTGFNL